MVDVDLVKALCSAVVRSIPGYNWIFDADDLAQDYMVRVYEGVREPSSPSQLAVKLRWLALNKIRDHTRRRAFVYKLEECSDCIDHLSRAELGLDFQRWCSSKDATVSTIMQLRVQGYGIVEIAKATGLSKSTVHRTIQSCQCEWAEAW